jgi:hypothetical protein
MVFYNSELNSGVIQIAQDEIDQYITLGSILKDIKQTIENHEKRRQ